MRQILFHTRHLALRADVAYSWQYAIDVTDSSAKNYRHQLPYTPEHSGNFSFTKLPKFLSGMKRIFLDSIPFTIFNALEEVTHTSHSAFNAAVVFIYGDNRGKMEFARLDLSADELFMSPYFYLQQNDVVVVEPNQARATSNQSVSLWLSMVGTVASAATVVVSVLSISGSK